MTKKDYQAIARAIHAQKAGGPDGGDTLDTRSRFEVWGDVRDAIADVFAANNPRFDRARFVEACETGRCKGMPR